MFLENWCRLKTVNSHDSYEKTCEFNITIGPITFNRGLQLTTKNIVKLN